MEKTINTRSTSYTNPFGQTATRSFEQTSYVGTPAELAELAKAEAYVYVPLHRECRQDAALMAELAALKLLPPRMDWESDEDYFGSFDMILFNHGEPEGCSRRGFCDLSPVFRFEEV